MCRKDGSVKSSLFYLYSPKSQNTICLRGLYNRYSIEPPHLQQGEKMEGSERAIEEGSLFRDEQTGNIVSTE